MLVSRKKKFLVRLKLTDVRSAILIPGILYIYRFDRTLGGVEFQLRLRDHLAKLFDKSKKTKMDLYSNNRAMAKLFKEAGRLMKVLSANNAHMSQVCYFYSLYYKVFSEPLVFVNSVA